MTSKADLQLTTDIAMALHRHKVNGGRDVAAIAILRSAADALLEPAATAPDAVPVTAHQRTKPSKARLARKAASLRRTGKAAAQRTLFDTYVLADGTPIGEVTYSELPAIARRSTIDAAVCWAVYHHATPTNQIDKVRDLVSEEFLGQAIAEAKGARDELAA